MSLRNFISHNARHNVGGIATVTSDHLKTADVYDILMLAELAVRVNLNGFDYGYGTENKAEFMKRGIMSISNDVTNVQAYMLGCQLMFETQEYGDIRIINHSIDKKFADTVIENIHEYKLSLGATQLVLYALDRCGAGRVISEKNSIFDEYVEDYADD